MTSEVHFRNTEVTRPPAPSVSLFPVEKSGDDVQVGIPGVRESSGILWPGASAGLGPRSVRGSRAGCVVGTSGRALAATHPGPGLRRAQEAAFWPGIGRSQVGAGASPARALLSRRSRLPERPGSASLVGVGRHRRPVRFYGPSRACA